MKDFLSKILGGDTRSKEIEKATNGHKAASEALKRAIRKADANRVGELLQDVMGAERADSN